MKNPSSYRQHQQGNTGEQIACQYLQAQGLMLLEKNYQATGGEIDLIMQDADELVFVEVRFRSRTDYVDAAESVTPMKQARLIRAAKQYLVSINKYDKIACRFDVVCINDALKTDKITWLKNAIDAY